MKTRIRKVPPPGSGSPGHFRSPSHHPPKEYHQLDTWDISTDPADEATLAPLREAATLLQHSDIPVAFPTETVYGLGADATRSSAVKGIYAAKGRPSDNPLIVHVCDLDMLRGLLRTPAKTNKQEEEEEEEGEDPIPAIYRPLLARFWPGPLTILLRAPPAPHNRLAPEVTAGLPTFGARMPASALARTLIQLAGTPLAAPSANASTKPSPTAASHVWDDLDGRIEMILDGGVRHCEVGVESTVVDGLCFGGEEEEEEGETVPVVLRPGGVSLDELRGVPGWEGTVKAYRDEREEGGEGGQGTHKTQGPRAPGMKYKHYSPKARVVLFEAKSKSHAGDAHVQLAQEIQALATTQGVVGVIRTLTWEPVVTAVEQRAEQGEGEGERERTSEQEEAAAAENGEADLGYRISTSHWDGRTVLDIALGHDTKRVAQGLFSALRELDRKGADVILVEGVEDKDDIAAAVMNRLRKAASEIRAQVDT